MTDQQAPEGTGMSEPAAAPPPLAPLTAPSAPPAETPPPAAPQPAVTWAPPPPPVAPVSGQRTVLALIAGIIMVVGGILFGLAGLAVAVLGRAVIESMGDLGQFPGLEGVDAGALAGGIMTFVGILILLFALAYLIGGIGVIRSRNWGRVLGLVVGILGGLLWLGSVTTPDVDGVNQSIGGSLVMFAVHAYIVVALLFFWRSKPATA
jgi:hypothetical protein